MVDPNSINSYAKIDRQKKIDFVMTIYNEEQGRYFTDREVFTLLSRRTTYSLEMNDVQPGISFALTDGFLWKHPEKVYDNSTGRLVRKCKANIEGRKKKIEEQVRLWEQG